MNAAEISRAIIAGKFNNEQLNTIIDAVRFAKSQLGKETKRSLSVGCTVKYRSTKMGREVTGIVQKIAIKYVTVDIGAGVMYRVPAAMLEAV